MACDLSEQAYLKWLNNKRMHAYTHKQQRIKTVMNTHTQQNTYTIYGVGIWYTEWETKYICGRCTVWRVIYEMNGFARAKSG